MIEAVIIDDESGARFMLRELLEKNFSDRITVKGEANGMKTGVELIRKHQPKLVFLDIKMPDGTGFELLEELEDTSFEVVFVTAYSNFAVKAFQFSAFGYLLKPIKRNDFVKTIEKLIARLTHLTDTKNQRLKVLIENYSEDKKVNKLVVRKTMGFDVVEIDKIIHLEGDGNYTHIVSSVGDKITSSKNLGKFEELLADMGFFRIHISTIINLRFVKAYSSENGGQVEMSDGSVFKLSRYRKEAFLSRFY